MIAYPSQCRQRLNGIGRSRALAGSEVNGIKIVVMTSSLKACIHGYHTHGISALRQIVALFDQCKSYWCNNLVCHIFSVFLHEQHTDRSKCIMKSEAVSPSTPIALYVTLVRPFVGHAWRRSTYVVWGLQIPSNLSWMFNSTVGILRLELSRDCVHWPVLKSVVFTVVVWSPDKNSQSLLAQVPPSNSASPLDLRNSR